MADIASTIAPKSDQLNADDLIAGPITITVAGVKVSRDEQPVAIRYEGDNGKPYKPGLSMRRVLVLAWGDDSSRYVGRRMTLYRDPEIAFGGEKVGGIRISHLSHIKHDMSFPLTVTRGKRKTFTVRVLADAASEKIEAGARALAERATSAETLADLMAITADESVRKQRAYLAQHRPELAEKVDRAVNDALARLGDEAPAGAGDFPGVVTPREDA